MTTEPQGLSTETKVLINNHLIDLDGKERADVMKAMIKADADAQEVRARLENETRRQELNSTGYIAPRVLFPCALVLAFMCLFLHLFMNYNQASRLEKGRSHDQTAPSHS